MEEVLSCFWDLSNASNIEVTIVSPTSTLTADDEHKYEEIEVDDVDKVNISDHIPILIWLMFDSSHNSHSYQPEPWNRLELLGSTVTCKWAHKSWRLSWQGHLLTCCWTLFKCRNWKRKWLTEICWSGCKRMLTMKWKGSVMKCCSERTLCCQWGMKQRCGLKT